MGTTTQRLYSFLKSARLAVVLLIIIAVASIVATLIPQGREAAFYYATYPGILASTVLALQFDSFFSSTLFVATILLFTLSLAVCAFDRIARELSGRRRRRFGPDLIHVGLLVLIAGGLVTSFARREAFFYLAAGEEIRLADRYVLHLNSFEFHTYETGRPKDWISTVDVFEDGELVVDDFPIEVNNPLALGPIDVYQTSYGNRARTTLTAPSGAVERIEVGKFFRLGDEVYLFANVRNDSRFSSGLGAEFERWDDRKVVARRVLGPGEKIGGYTVGVVEVREVTGLRAVQDPGYLPVLIGFILCMVGLVLTYAQKIGDKEI